MASPRVSVICIFYQAERFLGEALDSVLAQDLQDWELILADDGSTDGGTAIARDYVARDAARIRYCEHPGHANRGMSATRNLGLAQARGELVAFIDSDDHWRPAKLREQVAILDRNPSAGMVCGTVNYWNSWAGGPDSPTQTGHLRDAMSPPPDTALALYPLGTAAAPCPSDVMIRRTVLDQVGGFEESFTGELQMYEDQALFTKLYLSAPVYFASQIWLDYRLHPDSCVATVTRDGRYPAVRRKFLTWLEQYLEAGPQVGAAPVHRAIARARWRLDHPHAARWRRRLRRAFGR